MSWLTAAERARALAVAQAALPATEKFDGADARCIDRLQRLLDGATGLQRAFKAGLTALEAAALLRHRASLTTLPFGDRVALLEGLASTEGTHLLVRGVLAPLKAAYFDDPALFRALGCRYGVEPPAQAEQPRWRSQVVDASTFTANETIECDAVVVGTGAGGAPVAAELARRGHAVVLVEEGQYFTRRDFTGKPLEMMRTLYRSGGATMSLGNTVIPIPIGKGVGGTTLINSGTCFRVPERVLATWRAAGLSDFTEATLAPYFSEVEQLLGVGPSSAQALGATARLIAQGCDALGWSHHALARNAPGCDGQGLCCFGCPTDAKRSTNVSWVPTALDRGANLITGLAVDEVLREGDRAVGVSGLHGGSRLTIRAKVVVLSPVLLERNGLGAWSGQLGRNLSIHPASFALGVFDQLVNSWNSVPQGYAIDHFAHEGLYFEGAAVPLDLTAISLTGFGPSFMQLMERYAHTLTFGFMVKDTSRGRVTAGPNGAPRITYVLNDVDLQQVHRGFACLARTCPCCIMNGCARWATSSASSRRASLRDTSTSLPTTRWARRAWASTRCSLSSTPNTSCTTSPMPMSAMARSCPRASASTRRSPSWRCR
jgi:GMC oxidoreductase